MKLCLEVISFVQEQGIILKTIKNNIFKYVPIESHSFKNSLLNEALYHRGKVCEA